MIDVIVTDPATALVTVRYTRTRTIVETGEIVVPVNEAGKAALSDPKHAEIWALFSGVGLVPKWEAAPGGPSHKVDYELSIEDIEP